MLAPTLPGPFINPPVILRGVALIDDPTLFAADFGYREGTRVDGLVPGVDRLPKAISLGLQWGAAAAIAAPLLNLAATIGGPLRLQREALRRVLEALAPKRGSGPSDAALDAMGYAFDVRAKSSDGQRFAGRVEAASNGLPGVGQAVRKGDVLAWVVPTADPIERSSRQIG